MTLVGPARLWYDKQLFTTFADMIVRFKRQFSDVSSKQDAMNKIRTLQWNTQEKPFEYMARVAKIADLITPDFDFKMDIFKQGLPQPARTFISCANPRTEQELIETFERWIRDNNPAHSSLSVTTPDTYETIARSVLAALTIKDSAPQLRSRSPSPHINKRPDSLYRARSPFRGDRAPFPRNQHRVRFTSSGENSPHRPRSQEPAARPQHTPGTPHSLPPINIDLRLHASPRQPFPRPTFHRRQPLRNMTPPTPRDNRSSLRPPRCFKCNSTGHFARQCRTHNNGLPQQRQFRIPQQQSSSTTPNYGRSHSYQKYNRHF
jgi:hypothetical protein